MLEAKTKIGVRRFSEGYSYLFVNIPQKVAMDSQFPFKPNEEVMVKIDAEKKRLIIEGLKKGETHPLRKISRRGG